MPLSSHSAFEFSMIDRPSRACPCVYSTIEPLCQLLTITLAIHTDVSTETVEKTNYSSNGS